MLGKFGRGALIPSLDTKAFMMKESEISVLFGSVTAYISSAHGKNNETFNLWMK
jgi:hypothetical protein